MARRNGSSSKCASKGKRVEEMVAPKRGRTPRRSHGSAIPVPTGTEDQSVRKSRSVDVSRRSQVPPWTRERTRSVMGRLETSDASKSTSSSRKSPSTPALSCKAPPALGLTERKLLLEFEQNHETALLRLAHLLKANTGQLRVMLQWTTAEFDDRTPAWSPSRIARPTMTPENALRRRRRQHQLLLLRARMHNILRTFGVNNRIAAYRLGRFNAANVELLDDFCRELVRQETGVMPPPFITRSTSPQVDPEPTRRIQTEPSETPKSTAGAKTQPTAGPKNKVTSTEHESSKANDVAAAATQCEMSRETSRSAGDPGLPSTGRPVARQPPPENNSSLLVISRPADGNKHRPPAAPKFGSDADMAKLRLCSYDSIGTVVRALTTSSEKSSCDSHRGTPEIADACARNIIGVSAGDIAKLRICSYNSIGTVVRALTESSEKPAHDSHRGMHDVAEKRATNVIGVSKHMEEMCPYFGRHAAVELEEKRSTNEAVCRPCPRGLRVVQYDASLTKPNDSRTTNLTIDVEDGKTQTRKRNTSSVESSLCDDNTSDADIITPSGSRHPRLSKAQIIPMLAEIQRCIDSLTAQPQIAQKTPRDIGRRSSQYRKRRESDLKKWREQLKLSEHHPECDQTAGIAAMFGTMATSGLVQIAGTFGSVFNTITGTVNIGTLHSVCSTVNRHFWSLAPDKLITLLKSDELS